MNFSTNVGITTTIMNCRTSSAQASVNYLHLSFLSNATVFQFHNSCPYNAQINQSNDTDCPLITI